MLHDPRSFPKDCGDGVIALPTEGMDDWAIFCWLTWIQCCLEDGGCTPSRLRSVCLFMT